MRWSPSSIVEALVGVGLVVGCAYTGGLVYTLVATPPPPYVPPACFTCPPGEVCQYNSGTWTVLAQRSVNHREGR